MKLYFKIPLAFFLTVLILSGCKENILEKLVTGEKLSVNRAITMAIRTIYVSGNWGSDASTNPFSSSTPYKTLQKAHSITLPGDEVLIMEGTYTPSSTSTDPNTPILNITRSGDVSNWIVYKPYPGANPLIHSTGRRWEALLVNANFIRVEGLEVKGDNANLLLSDAKAAEIHRRAGGTDWARYSEYNTNGISFGKNLQIHHVDIRNCKVHDFPGGGIGGGSCDFVTIDGNVVYNNSWFGMYGTSGISILLPYNYNATTDYKIWITRNRVYGNKTQVPYYESASSALSDGNGIIIDINAGFTGKTLVENNISYLNGGGGIHTFKANNVDVFNNTAYMNEQVLPYANIDANQCNNIRFRNNIAYAKSGGKANDVFSGSNITFDYNIYFNGSVVFGGANSQTIDPSFINTASGDFWLQSSSPAINAGMSSSLSGTTSDFAWQTRLKNGRIDAGAYEVN